VLLLYELPALIIIPLFEKEEPGEISAVTDDFTSAEKSPLIPLCERGKLDSLRPWLSRGRISS
jgi:hypothetical protein